MKTYKSFEGICHDAVSILAGILGVRIDHAELLPVASESAGKSTDRLVEPNSDKSMKISGTILEGMNMKVGSFVRRSKDKVECEILAINTGVKLKSRRSGSESPHRFVHSG